MNKKAITTAGIVTIILGLLVILLIVTGPLRVGYEYAKEKFFGEKGVFTHVLPSREKEFQPYVGIKFSDEEKIIDDSVKAFICAVNSLAIRKKGWLEGVCPEGFSVRNESKPSKTLGQSILSLTGAVTQEICDGASYGQSCVECYTSEMGMKTVKLSINNDTATRQIAREVVACWEKFKTNKRKNTYCSKIVIPSGLEIYQKDPDMRWMVSKPVFREVLNNYDDVGDDLAGYMFISRRIGYTNENFKWNMPKIIFPDLSPFYLCARKRTFMEGTRPDKVFLTYDLDDCIVKKAEETEYKCTVSDFELPQEIGTDTKLLKFAQEWIERYKDPKYLVYYESFPRGEASAWHITPGSFFTDVILFGAAMNTIPVVGLQIKSAWKLGKGAFSKVIRQEAKTFTRESAEAVVKRAATKTGQELSERALTEMSQVFSQDGYELLLRSGFMYDDLLKQLPDISPKTIEEFRAFAVKQYPALKARGVADNKIIDIFDKKLFSLIPDEKVAKLSKAQLDTIYDDVFKKFVTKPLSVEEIAKLQKQHSVKQFFSKYLFTESGETLDKAVIDRIFSKAVSKEFFEGLSEEASQNIMKKATEYADEMVELGIVSGKAESQLVKEFNLLADTLSKKPENVKAINNFLESITQKELEQASKMGVLESVKNWRYNPIYIMPKEGWILPISRPTLLRFVGSPVGTLYTGPRAALRLTTDLWRNRVTRYGLAVIIGMSIARGDANNEKYAIRGGDSIVLQKPYNYDKNKIYDLSKDTSDFYLGLSKYNKDKKGHSRFFMASPCKADLALTRTKCSCEINNGEYLLYSTSQPIRPESVSMTTKDIKSVYMFDTLPEFGYKEDTEAWDVEYFQEGIIQKCVEDKTNTFTENCFLNIKNKIEIREKFLHYFYDNVYLPGFRFLKDNNAYLRELGATPDNMRSIEIAAMNILSRRDSLKDSPDFAGFYVLSGQNMIVAGKSPVFKIVKPTIVDGSEFRDSPLDFNAFVDIFEREYLEEVIKNKDVKVWWNDPIRVIYMSMRKSKNVLDNPFPDLFDKDNFIAIAAKNTLIHYNWVLDDQIDTSRVVKTCAVSSAKTSDTVFEVVKNDWTRGKVHPNCFVTNAFLEIEYNHGNNYCFSGDHAYIEQAKWVFNGLALTVDLVAGFLFPPAEIPVAIITGFGAGWAGHTLDKQKYWPKH